MENYISLLIQIPLVGIFVWFVRDMTTKTTDFIDKRDAQWRDIIRSQTGAMNDLAYQVSRNTAILIAMYRNDTKDDTATKLVNEILQDVKAKVE